MLQKLTKTKLEPSRYTWVGNINEVHPESIYGSFFGWGALRQILTIFMIFINIKYNFRDGV